jgi:hypothetical protein
MGFVELPQERSYRALIAVGVALLVLALFAITSALHLAGEARRNQEASQGAVQEGLRLSVTPDPSDGRQIPGSP